MIQTFTQDTSLITVLTGTVAVVLPTALLALFLPPSWTWSRSMAIMATMLVVLMLAFLSPFNSLSETIGHITQNSQLVLLTQLLPTVLGFNALFLISTLRLNAILPQGSVKTIRRRTLWILLFFTGSNLWSLILPNTMGQNTFKISTWPKHIRNNFHITPTSCARVALGVAFVLAALPLHRATETQTQSLLQTIHQTTSYQQGIIKTQFLLQEQNQGLPRWIGEQQVQSVQTNAQGVFVTYHSHRLENFNERTMITTACLHTRMLIQNDIPVFVTLVDDPTGRSITTTIDDNNPICE